MLCYYFSLDAVLQGVAKNNPIEKHIRLWSMRQHENSQKGKFKAYRYKLKRSVWIVNYNYLHPNIRSSHPEVLYEKIILKNFAKLTEKYLC